MPLSVRPAVYQLPSYSLTGDLLGFLRCGLQYRYTRIGQLPSTQPVQLWFGQFIHGVLEEAYLRYADSAREGEPDLPPWSKDTTDEILNLIKRRLAAQGLFPWSLELEVIGDKRATVAINELGPELFPIIHRAEVRLTGSRQLPMDRIPDKYRFREADRYEMVGVIDVVTHVELSDPAFQNNRLVEAILAQLPEDPPEHFEVIIDYKGMRRPPKELSKAGPSYWDIYGWQVQTYAHLRSMHEDSLPVVAGVIVYLNELLPVRGDLARLRSEIRSKETDVAPEPGSKAEKLLKAWREKDEDVPKFPLDYRLRRALRVVPISPHSISQGLEAFDDVVAAIEVCRGRELQEGSVLDSWVKNASDESTCTACDSKTYCPDCEQEKTPKLPGVRAR